MKRSKPRKRAADTPGRQLNFFPAAPLRSADEVDAEVLRAFAGQSTGLPLEVVKALRKVADGVSGQDAPETEWDSFKARASGITRKNRDAFGIDRHENDFICDLVRNAAEAGFWLALQRYSKHLHGSAEAMAFIKSRKAASEKGRETQAKRSSELHLRIREKWAAMEAAGEKATNDTVAAAMQADGVQCSRSTVIRAFKAKPSTAPAKRGRRLRR
jgi:hypothetical protein